MLHSVVSDLGLHPLLRPVCPNTYCIIVHFFFFNSRINGHNSMSQGRKTYQWRQRRFKSAYAFRQWSESSLGKFWTDKDTKLLHADNEDSTQPAQKHVLIWVLTCSTCPKVCFLSWNLHIPIFWHTSAKKVLTLVLLNPDLPCLCKQCRSRSVGFWRSQLTWICTVCH